MRLNSVSLLPRLSPALLAGLLLLTLGACGSDGDHVPVDSDASEEPEELRLPAEDLSGFVVFNQKRKPTWGTETNHSFLTFHSLQDGSQTVAIDMLPLTPQEGSRPEAEHFAFSPGFRYAAYPSADGLRIAELDDQALAYTVTTTLAPEQDHSFSGGSITYTNPQFSLDGDELWFTEKHEQDDEYPVLAVPLDDLEATPEERGTVPAGTVAADKAESGVKTGLGGWKSHKSAYGITSQGELILYRESQAPEGNLRWWVSEDDEILPDNFLRANQDTFLAPLSIDENAGYFSEGEQNVNTGSFKLIHTFTLDSKGAVQDPSPLFTNDNTEMKAMWVDDAGDRLIMQANGFFYQTSLSSPGEPTELFSELVYAPLEGESEADRLDPVRTVLGVYPPVEG